MKAFDTHVLVGRCSSLPGCVRLGTEQKPGKHLGTFVPGDCPRRGILCEILSARYL